MTWLSEDAARVIHADAMIFVDGLRRVKTQRRKRLVQSCIDETYKILNEGVRDRDEVQRRVQEICRARFSSLVFLWIISACVQWVVSRILDHIWKEPSDEHAATGEIG